MTNTYTNMHTDMIMCGKIVGIYRDTVFMCMYFTKGKIQKRVAVLFLAIFLGKTLFYYSLLYQ